MWESGFRFITEVSGAVIDEQAVLALPADDDVRRAVAIDVGMGDGVCDGIGKLAVDAVVRAISACAIVFVDVAAAELSVVFDDHDKIDQTIAVEVGDGDVLGVFLQRLLDVRGTDEFVFARRGQRIGGMAEARLAVIDEDAVRPPLLRQHQIKIAITVQVMRDGVHRRIGVLIGWKVSSCVREPRRSVSCSAGA